MLSSRRVKKGRGGVRNRPSVNGFMELRERGWSIRAAGREVGVARTTASNWARGYRTYRKGGFVGWVPPLERLAVRQISSRLGCMATGTFLDQGVSMLMPNPLAAAAACAALRVIEILALVPLVRAIERVPSIREVADVMRTAIFHVMEIGFLIGGALAASAFAGQWGTAIVIAAWFLNSRRNNPIMPMSLGAVAALGVGGFVNILAAIGFQIR